MMTMTPAHCPPLVSVVIPSYNRAHCIEKSVHSVLQQTYTHYEIIIVDDASTDATEVCIKEIVQANPQQTIHYLRNAHNQGGAAARNTGIQAAQGKYIAFLDSDDIWLPSKLEAQVEALESLGSAWGMSYTWLRCVDSIGQQTMLVSSSYAGDCQQQMLVANFVGSFSNVVIRRDLLLTVGGLDAHFKSCQDWDLFIRLSQQTLIHCLAEYAVEYLQSSGDAVRISTNPASVLNGHQRIQRKFAAAYANLTKPYRGLAFKNFMHIYASVGGIRLATQAAWHYLSCNFSLATLREALHMSLRATRKNLQRRWQQGRHIAWLKWA